MQKLFFIAVILLMIVSLTVHAHETGEAHDENGLGVGEVTSSQVWGAGVFFVGLIIFAVAVRHYLKQRKAGK